MSGSPPGQPRRCGRVALWALLSLSVAGCSGPTLATRAAPAPQGQWELSVAPMVGVFAAGDTGGPSATATVSARRGLSPSSDVGLRLSITGLAADYKRRLVHAHGLQLAVLAGVTAVSPALLFNHAPLDVDVGPHAAVMFDVLPESRVGGFVQAQGAWLAWRGAVLASGAIGVRWRSDAGNELRPGLCMGVGGVPAAAPRLGQGAAGEGAVEGGYLTLCWTVVVGR